MTYISYNIYENYHIIVILIAIIFFILIRLNVERLIALIIVILLIYYIEYIMRQQQEEQNKSLKLSTNKLKDDVKDIKEIDTKIFYIKEGSKSLKYLLKNKEFIDIIHNIRFIKRFDKSKYTNIIINMDKIMKIYIYILSDRYDINEYIQIFSDLKNETLEIFYSLVFVVPERFNHIYGFDPHSQINISMNNFLKQTNKMISIMKKYGTIEKNKYHISLEKYKPYEKNKEMVLP